MSTLATLLKTNTTKDVTKFLQAIVGDGTTRGSLMWGGRIYSWAASLTSNTDPALSLLRTVIIADSARILADLSDPTNDLIMKVFDDVPNLDDGTDGVGWSSIDYAQWLYEKNTVYEDGVPSAEYSEALSLLTDYVAGDLHNTHRFLHAITSRVWRRLDGMNLDALYLSTFILHTYAVYYNGWTPIPSHHSGLKHLHVRYLAGESIEAISDQSWHTPEWNSVNGLEHHPFTIHTPFTTTFLDDQETIMEHTWAVQIGGDILRLADYGKDGVAITIRVGDNTFVHFLGFPTTYNSAISMAFNTVSYGDDYIHGLCDDTDDTDGDDAEYIEDDATDIVSLEDTDDDADPESKETESIKGDTEALPVGHEKTTQHWIGNGFLHSYFSLI